MPNRSGVTIERLGRIVEDAASEVYIFAANDFRFRLVNRGARENLGYTRAELSALTPWDLKPDISRSQFLEMVRPLLAKTIERLDFNTVHRRKNGTVYDVAVQLQLIDDDGDSVFYAAIQDVTAHRRLENEARELARRLDAILDNTTMSVFAMDERQHCSFMNKAAERLTGFTFAEVTGRPLHDVIHHSYPDGRPFPLAECEIDRAFPENAGTQGEEVFVHKDGSFFPVAFTASPIRSDEAKVVGTILEVRDISEDRRREEARNLLMREVDHRARNILAIIQSLIQLTRAEDLASYKSMLAGRISALARAQTSLANRRWEGGCLDDVVREELEAFCPKAQGRISGPEVRLSADQVQPLSLLFHELATNANKYGACSQSGGSVSVAWTVDDGRVKLTWKEAGGPPVAVTGKRGFGTTLKTRVVQQLKGHIEWKWEPAGLIVEVSFPI
jgi:PAS domain S-box-containing protein